MSMLTIIAAYLIVFYIDWLLLRIFFIYYGNGAVCWDEDDTVIIFHFLPLVNILLLLFMIGEIFYVMSIFKKTKCEYVDKPKYNSFWEWFYQTKSYKMK